MPLPDIKLGPAHDMHVPVANVQTTPAEVHASPGGAEQVQPGPARVLAYLHEEHVSGAPIGQASHGCIAEHLAPFEPLTCAGAKRDGLLSQYVSVHVWLCMLMKGPVWFSNGSFCIGCPVLIWGPLH